MINENIKKIILPLLLVIIITSAFTFPKTVNANTNVTWLNSNWQYRREIILDNSSNTIALRNYLLTINLDYTNFDFQKADTSGYDFRFTLDDGRTVLDHQIEYYNYPKDARIKLKIPYAAAKITTRLYLYYGAKTSVSNISCDLSDPAALLTNLEVINEGEYSAPSNWELQGSGLGAQVIQTSNIWSYDAPKMSGTYALIKDSNFTQGELNFQMLSKDNDGFGVIFGYQDKNNYYRLAWFNDKKNLPSLPGNILSPGLYLQKQLNGAWSTLYHNSDKFIQDHWYQIKITLTNQDLKVKIDNRDYVNVQDTSLRGPKIALYSWANQGTYFKNVADFAGYENPNLYFPVAYYLGLEENYNDWLSPLLLTTPSSVIRIAENLDITDPNKIYFTKWPTPIFSGLAIYNLKVRLFVDDDYVVTLTPQHGEKSNVANWTYWLKEELEPGEHTVYTIPYRPETEEQLEPSPTIKFIVRDDSALHPTIIQLGENPKVDMTRVYVTRQTQPLITGLSPYGWPVRIYIDNQNIGDATVQDGEKTGIANFYIRPNLTKGRHILVAVTYNPETGWESKSPQVITFEVW